MFQALSAGDTIVAAINSSSAPTGFVPIGQDRTESVGGTVSTVKGGLTVKIEQASRLLCNLGDVVTTATLMRYWKARTNPRRRSPVDHGVGGLSPEPGKDSFLSGITATMITIKMNNLPKGVNLRWPHEVNVRGSGSRRKDRDRLSGAVSP